MTSTISVGDSRHSHVEMTWRAEHSDNALQSWTSQSRSQPQIITTKKKFKRNNLFGGARDDAAVPDNCIAN